MRFNLAKRGLYRYGQGWEADWLDRKCQTSSNQQIGDSHLEVNTMLAQTLYARHPRQPLPYSPTLLNNCEAAGLLTVAAQAA